MNTFEFNKIAMAVLGTAFILFAVNLMADAIFHTAAPANPGYSIAAVEPAGNAKEASGGGAPSYEPVMPLLASADPDAGATIAKKCASCHNLEKGAGKKVGPPLYGVVDRAMASEAGFPYSAGLKEAGAGKHWTYDELNCFLWNPKKCIKGTAMGFPGLKDVKDRANVIAYLRTLSDNPAPLPSQ